MLFHRVCIEPMDPRLASLLTELVEKTGLLRHDLKRKGDLEKYEARVARVDAMIAKREETLLPPKKAPRPEPEFKPAPMPVLDDPNMYGAQFFERKAARLPDPPKPKPRKPKGRRPIGDLGPKHDRFRVVDGDRVSDVDNRK